MPNIQTFRCTVVVNITNGFGTTVEEKINNADIPLMIEEQSNGLAKVMNLTQWWDSGVFSHDLYLQYDIRIDCESAVKDHAGKIASGTLRLLNLQTGTVKRSLRTSIEDGFLQELNGCGKSMIAVLKSCRIKTL